MKRLHVAFLGVLGINALFPGARVSCWGIDRAIAHSPIRLMYGYNDGMRALWSETIEHFNVITGVTKSADFVEDLRKKNVVFAYQVLARSGLGQSPEATVTEWEKPFLNDLGGSLPGGFDAIAIDEIGSRDDSAEAARVARALELLRNRYPDRGVYVWGTRLMGQRSLFLGSYTQELLAVARFADLFLFESYVAESSPDLRRFASSALYFDGFGEQLLSKTVFALTISQTPPFVEDNDEKTDFQGLLDSQFALLRNDAILRRSAGVGFFAFYRARADIISYVNQLIDHYYIKGDPSDFGDALLSVVRNAGFEEGSAGWEVTDPTRVRAESYGMSPDLPPNHGGVSHGKLSLQMSGPGEPVAARQQVALQPDTWYTLSALAIMSAGATPELHAFDASMNELPHFAGTASRWKPWQQLLLTFRTDASGMAAIELESGPFSDGSEMHWDFVGLSRCTGSNQPPVLTRLVVRHKRLFLEGENLMPGGSLTVGSAQIDNLTWVDNGTLDAGLAPLHLPSRVSVTYVRPASSLHRLSVTATLPVELAP